MEQGSKLGFTDRMCKEWEVASLMGNTPDVPNKAADTARVIMDTRATDVAVAAKEGGVLLSTKTGKNVNTQVILKRTATGTASDISRGELDDIDKDQAALKLAIMFLSEYNRPKKGKIEPIFLRGRDKAAIQRVHAAILFLAKESKAEAFKDIHVVSSEAGPDKGWLYGKQSDAFISTHLKTNAHQEMIKAALGELRGGSADEGPAPAKPPNMSGA